MDHHIKSQKNLNIKPDEHGILRCYGRLKHADVAAQAKTPVYIAPRTALARLIILEAHGQYHCGVSHTMAKVRECFWTPKLRQQVRVIIQKCIPCQKYNNLPFRYPQMENLPGTRVQRSHPFEHIGLDYFGPLTITATNGDHAKVYGCILTCQTTRLIHLELVEDMTTETFLNALRRFFARRGVPRSITCDNAPTFLLGEQILLDTIKRMTESTTVESALAQREIEWRHITPYAPWQGGFYERLIRSIKQSMYKALGKRTVTFDILRTTLVEIEAVLNSRPLTYQEEQWEQQPLLRPIDFLQNNIILSFPFEFAQEQRDTTYYTPEEAQRLATQRQVERALQSSIKLTEDFWKIWREQYLTGLREYHRLHMNNDRGTNTKPQEGEVVLLCDSTQPRNTWKIGRVVELQRNQSDTVREVIVELPNKTRIRRPVNRLVPLEIEKESESRSTKHADNHSIPIAVPANSSSSPTPPMRYNLRERQRIQYRESDIDDDIAVDKSNTTQKKRQLNVVRNLPTLLLLLSLLFMSANASQEVIKNHRLQCTPGGVILTQPSNHPYEICADDFCLDFKSPRKKEIVQFPPEVTLHDHVVKWKISDGSEYNILEFGCDEAPFCTQINCTFCTTAMTNPECWPRTAIFLTGLSVYVMVTLCYILFHVPIIIGNPLLYFLKTLGRSGLLIATALMSLMRRISNRLGFSRRRRRRLWSEIAILGTIVNGLVSGCQEVFVYDHHIQSCHKAQGREICSIDTSEIVKINPYKQEASLQFKINNTVRMEVKLSWKSLELTCEKETIVFSRSTRYNVLDSKRCPHAGSCTGQKCGTIRRTSRVMEVDKANDYPGVTGCVESCGGPGCDCFYPSSGCLFYRIYLVPNDNAVYEIFRCTRWREAIYLQLAFNSEFALKKVHNFLLSPNIPKRIPPFTIVLSSLSTPPTPILNTRFITNGTHTAIAPRDYSPPLRCATWDDAYNMTCEVTEDCKCSPAEIKMLCDCKDVNLTSHILDLKNRLPILRPHIEICPRHGKVMSRISRSSTAEFIIRVKGEFSTTAVISEAICTIPNTHSSGCYNCAKGALADVICTSSTPEERAEVRCGEEAFTIPCTSAGVQSQLRFVASRARFQVNCSVQCGSTRNYFEVVGILKYTGNVYMAARRLLDGERKVFSEINLPDFDHIIDVFLRWSGTLLITVTIVALALLFTMSYKYLEERLKRELQRKIAFVERSTVRPTEPIIQQRLRSYGNKCHEAHAIIQQARYEFAALMNDKKDLFNQKGGAYHYLVTIKQLYETHKQQRRDLSTAAECFALAHDWYDVLVTVDEAEELSRLGFLNALGEEEFLEPTQPGEQGYPEPAKVRSSYLRKDVLEMMKCQLLKFDTLLREEKDAAEHAEIAAKHKSALEDAAMREWRNAYFDLQDELRRQHEETADWMRKMEGEYAAIMSRVNDCASVYKEFTQTMKETAEGQRKIMAQLARYEKGNRSHCMETEGRCEEGPSCSKTRRTHRDDKAFEDWQHNERVLRESEQELAEIEQVLNTTVWRERNFGNRAIKWNEELLMCVYCRENGKHYSDACPEVRTVVDRKKLLELEGRCLACVEIHADRCIKRTPCFYCKTISGNKEFIYSHHSSICPKPEEYVNMLRRRNELNRTIEHCKKIRAELGIRNQDETQYARTPREDYKGRRDTSSESDNARRANQRRRSADLENTKPSSSGVRG